MELKLAVLIDVENIPSAYVKEMMEVIAKYGKPAIKRIYGDWTKTNLYKWEISFWKIPLRQFNNMYIHLGKM